MNTLPPRLTGFIEGLCAASTVHFPQGGLYVRHVAFGAKIVELPSRATEPKERIMEYLVCALGDTTRTNVRDAQTVTESLFAELEIAFPGTSVHTEIEEHAGWFDLFNIWVTSTEGQVQIALCWGVS